MSGLSACPSCGEPMRAGMVSCRGCFRAACETADRELARECPDCGGRQTEANDAGLYVRTYLCPDCGTCHDVADRAVRALELGGRL